MTEDVISGFSYFLAFWGAGVATGLVFSALLWLVSAVAKS